MCIRDRANPDYSELLQAIIKMGILYVIGIAATFGNTKIMVYVTQGTMRNIRNDMFKHMESLPIKYFDTHKHGDIMSMYTNDVDTLRQMVSQSIPQFIDVYKRHGTHLIVPAEYGKMKAEGKNLMMIYSYVTEK